MTRLAFVCLVFCAVPAVAHERHTHLASCPQDGYEAVMTESYEIKCAPSADLVEPVPDM
jgi:hypothetical protein